MASSSFYSEDLTCSVCLTVFTDPVTLLCGHSFCRDCISVSLKCQNQCPQCRRAVSAYRNFTTNHILKSLAEKAKHPEILKKEYRMNKQDSGSFCPEHEEKLKLFCVTDQQLACIICRDCERHEGHKFKPVKEAAVSLRTEFETFLKQVSNNNLALESTTNTQKEEITKSKERSQQLLEQFSSQFEEMHQFLRRREDEIKNELKLKENEEVRTMVERLNAAEYVLSEGKELENNMKSVLKVSDPDEFLKNWTENDHVMKMKSSFKPKRTLQVVKSSLSLMPYESHLQFFMWKEMLEVVKSRPEQISFTSKESGVIISNDGRSLMSACLQCLDSSSQRSTARSPLIKPIIYSSSERSAARSPLIKSAMSSSRQRSYDDSYRNGYYHQNPVNYEIYPYVYSTNQFTSGQHYWEIDVGQRSYWELGIQHYFLKFENSKYTIYNNGEHEKLFPGSWSNKIGVYLNLSSNEISFYDAENMKHIGTLTIWERIKSPVSAHFRFLNYENTFPVISCWY